MKTNNNNFLGCFIALALLFASGIARADIPPGYSVLETITYEYDAEGNRVARGATVSGVPETPIEAQYDQGNRLTQLTLKGQGQNGADTTCTLAYDLNGNLANKTCSYGGSTSVATQYTWDSRNRLTGIQSPGLTASFQYDPLGRRIERTVNGHTTHYLYDGTQAIAELSDTGSTSYLTGLAIDEVIARYTTEGERTLLTDALGSVLIASKEDTTVATAYGYSPYGETQLLGMDEQNPVQYTSRENDGTGLYFYRARYYDPQLKRFISEDPIGLLGGINVYAYVDGNPLIATDPEGLNPIVAGGGAAEGSIVGGVGQGSNNGYGGVGNSSYGDQSYSMGRDRPSDRPERSDRPGSDSTSESQKKKGVEEWNKLPPINPGQYSCRYVMYFPEDLCKEGKCPPFVTGRGYAPTLSGAMTQARSEAQSKIPPGCGHQHHGQMWCRSGSNPPFMP